MNLLSLVLMTHSLVRWVIEIVSAIALIWFLLVWLRGLRSERLDRGLMAAFSGVIDIQVFLGIIYILWSGFAGAGFPRYRIEHAIIMIVAAVLAHLSVRWRDSDYRLRARNNLFLILGVMVLVIIGLSRVPGA